MYRSSPLRSTLNMGYITALDMCEVCTEAVHSVALWTRVVTALDMCEVCTEAVHSVARVTSQLWTCVKYVPKQSTPQHFEHDYITASDMCALCTDAVHSVALWTRVVYITALDMWEVCTEGVQSSPFFSTLNTNVITGFGHVSSMNRRRMFPPPRRNIWSCTTWHKNGTRKLRSRCVFRRRT